MFRSTLLAVGLATAALLPTTHAADAGTAYCFGVNCPCGNDDPNAGCRNSSGQGALLSASGSNSLSTNDLSFHGTSMSLNSVCLVITAEAQQALPFKDGKLCVAGTMQRLFKHNNSGASGIVNFNQVLDSWALNTPPVVFSAGQTANFQIWFRDSPGNQSGCGQKSNLTNGYQITFQP